MALLFPTETINLDIYLNETNCDGWFCQVPYVLDIANRTYSIPQD